MRRFPSRSLQPLGQRCMKIAEGKGLGGPRENPKASRTLKQGSVISPPLAKLFC